MKISTEEKVLTIRDRHKRAHYFLDDYFQIIGSIAQMKPLDISYGIGKVDNILNTYDKTLYTSIDDVINEILEEYNLKEM